MWIAHLVPRAVICLLSALAFYNLTTQVPGRVYLALPKDTKKPRFKYPPLEVIWLSGTAYTEGIEEQRIEETAVRVYCREKTVADCFRFRNKIGRDVALEALKDYFKQGKPDLNALLRYARIDRVFNIMQPYLETLIVE